MAGEDGGETSTVSGGSFSGPVLLGRDFTNTTFVAQHSAPAPVALAQQVRRFEEAITAYQDAAAIYRETGDRHREGLALVGLGLALVEVRAVRGGDQRPPGRGGHLPGDRDRHGEGNALTNLGLALREVRRFEEAISAHQDATAIYRETGDRHREGLALVGLGLALVEVRAVRGGGQRLPGRGRDLPGDRRSILGRYSAGQPGEVSRSASPEQRETVAVP